MRQPILPACPNSRPIVTIRCNVQPTPRLESGAGGVGLLAFLGEFLFEVMNVGAAGGKGRVAD